MRTTKSRATPARKALPAVALSAIEETATAASPLPVAPLSAAEVTQREAMVRLVAYSFYERRGYVAGDELQDWLKAEMEVERQLTAEKPSTAPN